tara:strand:- start:2366 stop:2590 length:225 start_codon:yes stop_codon:yes gene_type:complete
MRLQRGALLINNDTKVTGVLLYSRGKNWFYTMIATKPGMDNPIVSKQYHGRAEIIDAITSGKVIYQKPGSVKRE